MEKYKNKYRIPSTRLRNWNYSNNAIYFITIITKNRKHFFGEIVKTTKLPQSKQIHLSEIGEIAQNEWCKTPKIRPDMNLKLLEFIVMPDHFHGIIVIGKNEFNGGMGKGVVGLKNDVVVGDARHCASTLITNCDYGKRNILPYKNTFSFQTKNLASIIRGFKSAVTIQARKVNPSFAWQPRFYDRIIRTNESYQATANYIKMNPTKWIL